MSDLVHSNLNIRRTQLQHFAALQLLKPNRAVAVREIIKTAAYFVTDVNSSNPAAKMMNDLKAVMIGDGYVFGRGEGDFYVVNHPLLKGKSRHFGSEGFAPHYSDGSFQVHHVFAALLLGRIVGAESYAIFSEKTRPAFGRTIEWWDIYLYQDLCPIGRAVNNQNYTQLADTVYDKLTNLN